MEMDNILDGLKENKKTLIIALVLIVVIIVVSILNLFLDNNNNEIVDMDGIMQSFAKIYYEDSYYPGVINIYGINYIDTLKEDEKKGIKLTLNEIVEVFEDVDSTKFYQKGNYCNYFDTYAVISPKAPYGVEDYEIDVKISCDKKISNK